MDNLIISSSLSMGGLAIFFAIVLAIADKKLKVEENPTVAKINGLLPHANCAACGFISCHDFAEHLASGKADPNKCRVIEEDDRVELFNLLGKEAGVYYPVIPLVGCAAEWKDKKIASKYEGILSCRSANVNQGGGMPCEYGCMGFGDCAEACPFGALMMENGLPKLTESLCTGCGKCASACPRNIISMQEKKNEAIFYVACSSIDDGRRVREVCGVGCIACGICEKLSPEGFFVVKNNLSKADYSKQKKDKFDTLEKILLKCPTKVILKI